MVSDPTSTLDHIYLDVSDYERSKSFFTQALAPMGIELVMERDRVAGFGRSQKPELWIRSWQIGLPTRAARRHAGRPGRPTSSAHPHRRERQVAGRGGQLLPRRDRSRRKRQWRPGLRAEYHPTYYGAFVLDPDGHDIEAVFHGF